MEVGGDVYVHFHSNSKNFKKRNLNKLITFELKALFVLMIMDCFSNHSHDHSHSLDGHGHTHNSDKQVHEHNTHQIKEEEEEVHHISYSATHSNGVLNLNKSLSTKLKKNPLKSLFEGK